MPTLFSRLLGKDPDGGDARSPGAPKSGEAAASYDEVRVPGPEGEKPFTKAQFEALPLVERIRLLAGGHLRFLRQGQEISAADAMARR